MLPLRGMASKCDQHLSFTTVNGCAVTVYNSENMNTDCCFNQNHTKSTQGFWKTKHFCATYGLFTENKLIKNRK
jgi:hypothetical protein